MRGIPPTSGSSVSPAMQPGSPQRIAWQGFNPGAQTRASVAGARRLAGRHQSTPRGGGGRGGGGGGGTKGEGDDTKSRHCIEHLSSGRTDQPVIHCAAVSFSPCARGTGLITLTALVNTGQSW